MNTTEVLALLEANKNDRGIANWKKLGAEAAKLKSFGIGLTQLRKLAKQIGRDHDLAMKLWKSDVYDAKVIALLIDDPKAVTQEQAEAQVEELGAGLLSHVFSSCDATLAKTSFVVELASKWMDSKDPVRRGCGYGLLYETFDREERSVHGSMGGALMGIGKRNATLNAAALKVAQAIGPIQIEADYKCEPFDVVKHLTNDRLRQKLGV